MKWYRVKPKELIKQQYKTKEDPTGNIILMSDGYFINTEMLTYDKVYIGNNRIYDGWYWDQRILIEENYLQI